MVDCIFCKIAKGEIPSYKVYEDKDMLAFLDINPVNPGHILVIPKEHYTTVIDMPLKLYKNIAGAVWEIYGWVSHAIDPDGVNIIQNNEEEAGQEIPHYHVHIVPRYQGDNDFYRLNWKTRKLTDSEMKDVLKRINAAKKS